LSDTTPEFRTVKYLKFLTKNYCVLCTILKNVYDLRPNQI